jgi:hypothetical protein
MDTNQQSVRELLRSESAGPVRRILEESNLPHLSERAFRCIVCGKLAAFRCSKCRAAWYCGAECQRKDSAEHSKNCRGSGRSVVSELANAWRVVRSAKEREGEGVGMGWISDLVAGMFSEKEADERIKQGTIAIENTELAADSVGTLAAPAAPVETDDTVGGIDLEKLESAIAVAEDASIAVDERAAMLIGAISEIPGDKINPAGAKRATEALDLVRRNDVGTIERGEPIPETSTLYRIASALWSFVGIAARATESALSKIVAKVSELAASLRERIESALLTTAKLMAEIAAPFWPRSDGEPANTVGEGYDSLRSVASAITRIVVFCCTAANSMPRILDVVASSMARTGKDYAAAMGDALSPWMSHVAGRVTKFLGWLSQEIGSLARSAGSVVSSVVASSFSWFFDVVGPGVSAGIGSAISSTISHAARMMAWVGRLCTSGISWALSLVKVIVVWCAAKMRLFSVFAGTVIGDRGDPEIDALRTAAMPEVARAEAIAVRAAATDPRGAAELQRLAAAARASLSPEVVDETDPSALVAEIPDVATLAETVWTMSGSAANAVMGIPDDGYAGLDASARFAYAKYASAAIGSMAHPPVPEARKLAAAFLGSRDAFEKLRAAVDSIEPERVGVKIPRNHVLYEKYGDMEKTRIAVGMLSDTIATPAQMESYKSLAMNLARVINFIKVAEVGDDVLASAEFSTAVALLRSLHITLEKNVDFNRVVNDRTMQEIVTTVVNRIGPVIQKVRGAQTILASLAKISGGQSLADVYFAETYRAALQGHGPALVWSALAHIVAECAIFVWKFGRALIEGAETMGKWVKSAFKSAPEIKSVVPKEIPLPTFINESGTIRQKAMLHISKMWKRTIDKDASETSILVGRTYRSSDPKMVDFLRDAQYDMTKYLAGEPMVASNMFSPDNLAVSNIMDLIPELRPEYKKALEPVIEDAQSFRDMFDTGCTTLEQAKIDGMLLPKKVAGNLTETGGTTGTSGSGTTGNIQTSPEGTSLLLTVPWAVMKTVMKWLTKYPASWAAWELQSYSICPYLFIAKYAFVFVMFLWECHRSKKDPGVTTMKHYIDCGIRCFGATMVGIGAATLIRFTVSFVTFGAYYEGEELWHYVLAYMIEGGLLLVFGGTVGEYGEKIAAQLTEKTPIPFDKLWTVIEENARALERIAKGIPGKVAPWIRRQLEATVTLALKSKSS